MTDTSDLRRILEEAASTLRKDDLHSKTSAHDHHIATLRALARRLEQLEQRYLTVIKLSDSRTAIGRNIFGLEYALRILLGEGE